MTSSFAQSQNSCINDPESIREMSKQIKQIKVSQAILAKELNKYNEIVDEMNLSGCTDQKVEKLSIVSDGDANPEVFSVNSEVVKSREYTAQQNIAERDSLRETQKTGGAVNTGADPAQWPRTYKFWLDCSHTTALTFDVIMSYTSLDDQKKNHIAGLKKLCTDKGGRYGSSMHYEVLHRGVGTKVYQAPVSLKSSIPSKKVFPKTYEMNIRCAGHEKFKYIQRYLTLEEQRAGSNTISKAQCDLKFPGENITNWGATFKLIGN